MLHADLGAAQVLQHLPEIDCRTSLTHLRCCPLPAVLRLLLDPDAFATCYDMGMLVKKQARTRHRRWFILLLSLPPPWHLNFIIGFGGDFSHPTAHHRSVPEEACTQQGLAGILACKKLRVLSARGCQLGNGQISTMGSRLSHLQCVDISKTAVHTCLFPLPTLPALPHLLPKSSQVPDLCSMLQVDDDGVTMLALMCDLRELSLRECAVSDAGLESLAQGAKNIEVLDLSRCKVRNDPSASNRLAHPAPPPSPSLVAVCI